MKQYVVDELRQQDYEKIKAFLDEKQGPSEMGGIYWIPLEREYLAPVQIAHKECQPIYYIIDLKPDSLSCELLLRTKSRIRCDCIRYADGRQIQRIIQFVDDLLEKLEIKI